MRYFSFPALPAAAMLLTAGCVDFDYVGRELSPTPDSTPVVYFINREQIPPGEYRIMGRVVITAPDGTDGYEIQELLMEKARLYGADAVCLVRVRKVDVGFFSRTDSAPAAPQRPLDPANVDFKGAPSTEKAEQEEYGPPVLLTGEKKSRREVLLEALYLKNKTELDALTSGQDREISGILGEKAEPARSETLEEVAQKPDAEESAPESGTEKSDSPSIKEEKAQANPESEVEQKAESQVDAKADSESASEPPATQIP